MLKSVIAGAIAGLVGAAIWAVISNMTGYEIGWVAWGVGALVGIAVGAAAGRDASEVTGFIAVALSLCAIGGGKFADTYYFLATDPSVPTSLSDENVISYFADGVVIEYQALEKPVNWPEGVDPENAWVESDYPADVWAEAEASWYGLSASEQEAWRAEYEVDPLALSIELFPSTFSLFDGLWVFLACFTAYGIARGGNDDELDVEDGSDPGASHDSAERRDPMAA
ncbi:MAG: hypothetical protein ACF8GE_01660 [Phycisphaerales bacterium JB043]